MMLPSHLLGALVLGVLLGMARGRPLRSHEWMLALGFGVVIDLDHLLALPAFVLANGAAALDPSVGLSYGAAWQGFMHTPWALLVVLPAMWWWRSALPAIFWGLHMWQDFVIARHYVVFGSAHEWSIVLMLAGVLWTLVALQRGAASRRRNSRPTPRSTRRPSPAALVGAAAVAAVAAPAAHAPSGGATDGAPAGSA